MVNGNTLDAMHRQLYGPNAGAQATAGQAPANARPAPAVRDGVERVMTAVQAKLAALRTRLVQARRRRETAAALAALDDETLRDLGIESRAAIPAAASAAVAQDPAPRVRR
ncbi:protein of unknown function [Limimonas halophila]|uniref:YjiS-like domain-containing protein n=1 Tax=Limimonas halophila TaxID=1082479 RepID=A0A1G7S0Q4_9PROT|nr:DUF1127 domain-containing protein [Limimonas halophila]SDG16612.1 protein of unknown function [Limimonas halophila]